MRLKAFLTVLVALFALPVGATPVTFLSVQPSSLSTTVGQTFSLDINVTDAVDLYAWQFDLGFDPAILSANSVSEGSFLASGGSTFFFPGTIDNTGGTILFNAGTLQGPVPGVTGSGTVATISFTALSTGTSAVTIDPTSVMLIDSSFGDLGPSLQSGSVSVSESTATPVPEPASMLLLGTGLIGLSRLRRRKPAGR